MPWITADLEKAKNTWTSNGGELIRMPAMENKAYLEQALSVLPAILERNPASKEDYAVLKAASDKYR